MLTGLLIAAIFALGVAAAVVLAAWTIACLAEWVFGLFDSKSPDIDSNITIKDPNILNQVVTGITEKDPELGRRINDAIFGSGTPKAVSVYMANGQAREVSTLEAKDASVDEVSDKVLRFERYTRQIKEY